MSNKTTQTTTANGSSTAAERSAAGQAAPPPLTPSAALAELMPGLSAEPADAGAPAAVSAAFVKPGRVSFFNSAFAVFLVALICRFCFAWSGISDPEAARFFRPDSASYLAPALTLAETGEYRGPDGSVTAHRTPGFPAFLGVLTTFGVRPTCEAETIWISVFLLVLGALTVFPIYCACRYVSSRTCSALAATAIAHAPLLLSDTFFTLIVAFVLFFFVSFAFGVKKDPFYYFSAVFLAAIAALIRPINLFFFVPLIVAMLLIDPLSLRKKLFYSAVTCLIFFVILFPWIARNHAIGAGWRLDASSASTMVHNAAAVESVVTQNSGEELRHRYEETFKLEFESEPFKYRIAGARMDHIESEMTDKILEHPFLYAYLTLRPWVFLPDVPTLLENQGVTQTERGTFDVLNREGIFAAVRHYFDGNGGALAATIPLLLTVLVLYLAAAAGWIAMIRKKQWLMAFLLIGFGLYYTLLTGPVQMPRYQLPVLPVLAFFAAIALQTAFERFRKEKAVTN